ncbi:kinetochore protein Spc25 isoform X1 [Gadus morhua]|uniref:kinetochore protein Spc25 isoform X1 n=2 Tax=Gadus morhua TaxID=8049 RepID=UPI0011B745D2|nr:kinetochore protein Spc25 isoform X1 [Gadus morhua]
MTMASIKDPHVVDSFRVAMEEVYSRLLVQTSGEISEAAVELGLSHRRSMKSAADTCSKKCEDDKLFETIQTNKQDLAKKTLLMKEKRDAISRSLVEMEQKQGQKDALRLQMETLREEQAERRGLVVSQNRANKDRLKNLLKAKQVFQERLGLEIRRIHGQKLQFVFQNVNPASPENVYTFTMGINADGSYQIMSSDPVLESLGDLDKRLKQTNNISAFLANIRKEFVAQACFSTGS